MSTIVTGYPRLATVQGAVRLGRQRLVVLAVGSVVTTLVVSALTVLTAPQPVMPVVLVALACVAVMLARPHLAVPVLVFLALVGDAQNMPWFPVLKNFSSRESVAFVHDAAIVSPFELLLVVAVVSWGLRQLGEDARPLEKGTLLRPILVVVAFVAVGYVVGVVVRTGDVNVALWQVRPFAYVVVVYLLATNLCTRPRHWQAIMLAAAAAVVVEAGYASWAVSRLSGAALEYWRVLGIEHSASLHFALVGTWFVAGAILGVRRRGPCRVAVWVALLPLGYAFANAERRSAVVALIGASILLAIVLYHERRRTFWWLVPLLVVVGVAYVAAFWNGAGPTAFPAQAVKSVIAPAQLVGSDQSSNLYRELETLNLVAMVNDRPLFGFGFGQRMVERHPLPFLPFEWAGYFPHNSILWHWSNAGLGGLLSLLVLVGVAVRDGARASLQRRDPRARALLLAATLYVVMYMVYAYVDIAWEAQSLVMFGVALAVIGNADRVGQVRDTRPCASPVDGSQIGVGDDLVEAGGR